VPHRHLKERLYPQFARVGAALASEKRLELLDLLAQAPRSVEALALETAMSVANTSRHLQTLKASRLVDSERERTRVIYRLASEEVLRLWLALRSVAETRLAEVGQIARELGLDGGAGERVPRDELERLISLGKAVVVDVRPALEYDHGHLPDAVSIPLDTLPEAADALPRDRRLVVYCRGAYCQFADQAVAILRQAGFDAVRLEGGWPEWVLEGRRTSVGMTGSSESISARRGGLRHKTAAASGSHRRSAGHERKRNGP
jgi:rhodanese-related sulfurtransferase